MATKTLNLKVGDKVTLVKATRHNMIPAGSVGTVVEIRESGCKYTDGVTVEFMRKPDPRIASMFGKDPSVAEPFRCLFPAGSAALTLAAGGKAKKPGFTEEDAAWGAWLAARCPAATNRLDAIRSLGGLVAARKAFRSEK